MALTEVELADGTFRRLGNNAPDPGLLMSAPVYGETGKTPLVPRSEWKARCDALGLGPESRFLPPTHDQNGIGQCNADATTGAMESQRAKQGLVYVQLSAADLYSQINGGRDNGSTLFDGLRAASEVGVGTAATCGTVWKRGNWKGPVPASERARFRVLEAFLCPTFDHCFSAVLMEFDLISGIYWYDSYTPGEDGWLPRGRGSSGGHAVHGYKPTYKGDRFGIWHQNSWSPRWGLNGRCVFPEDVYTSGGIGGWWAVRQVVDEGGVVPTEQG